MVQTGTFAYGIIDAEGRCGRDFTLHERTFRHALELANDSSIDKDLFADPAYYDAAVISKRLKVEGIDRLTPEMVLDLEGEDSDLLANAIVTLDQRRTEFRKEQQAAQKAAAGPA